MQPEGRASGPAMTAVFQEVAVAAIVPTFRFSPYVFY